MLISHVTNASRGQQLGQFQFISLEPQPRRPPNAMIESFELATEYSAIRDKPENYDVPHEDDFSDKDPNELLEGQSSSQELVGLG